MKAGVASLYLRTASCSNGVEWFQSRGRWSAYPAIGAQVFYGPGGGTHTGIVYAYDASTIYTYEGNTSTENDANGNKVMRRERRRRNSYVYGYGLPQFAEGIVTADPDLKGRPGFTYQATASGPAGNSGSTSGSSTRTVTVRAGQTLAAIAAAAGISLATLLSLNPSVQEHPDQIHPGDTITVPAHPGEVQQPEPDPTPTTPPTGSSFPGAGQFGPGANNGYVTKLGQLLVQRGGSRFYSEGPGPRWGEADRQAVRAFQLAQGWGGAAADGISGPQTWDYLINGKGRNIGSSTATPVGPSTASSSRFPGRQAFRPGATNPNVTLLGKQLVRRGYGQYYQVGPGPRWTEADRRAVQAFQRNQGWKGNSADGYPGPQTWSRLTR